MAIERSLHALTGSLGLGFHNGKPSHDHFFRSGVEQAACRLLHHYPALARIWAIQVELWLRFVQELMMRARCFKETVSRADGPLIQGLRLDLSDLHDGNRSVVRFRFADKTCWYYKPRSGQREQAWFDLLAWANESGFPRRFKIVQVVSAQKYCWMKEVAHYSCKRRGDVGDYFFRAGALLYLVHRLGGVDFHAGNIIAHGGQPVIVDCETLFHPNTKLPVTAEKERRSLWRTGMLPIYGTKGLLSDSVTALGRASFGGHSVCLRGEIISANQFAEEIIHGFRQMHHHFHAHAQTSVITRILDRLLHLPTRTIYRPTSHYYAMLDGSLSPAILTSGGARSRFLLAACSEYGSTAVRNAEVQALTNADIPIFHSRVRSLRYYGGRSMRKDINTLTQVFATTATTAANCNAKPQWDPHRRFVAEATLS